MAYYLRYNDKELTMHDVDEMERKYKDAVKDYKKRKLLGAAQVAGEISIAVVETMLGGHPNPHSRGHSIQNRYNKIVGDTPTFDREKYLLNHSFQYQGRTVILDGYYRHEVEKEILVRGTSPNCSISVNSQNCVSFKRKGLYPNSEGYENWEYETFEFHSKEDADKFYEALKRCL